MKYDNEFPKYDNEFISPPLTSEVSEKEQSLNALNQDNSDNSGYFNCQVCTFLKPVTA